MVIGLQVALGICVVTIVIKALQREGLAIGQLGGLVLDFLFFRDCFLRRLLQQQGDNVSLKTFTNPVGVQ